MKRIKVLKAYMIIWLFILYIVYTNAELLSVFFMATVIFSTAILGLLVVGTLYQIVSGYGIMMLGGTFGALAYKKTGYEFYIKSIDSLLPANIAHMLITRKSQQTMLFTQDESRNIIDWLDSKFRKQKSYINFFINTSMLIGLLGTFVGLVEAIDNMGQIILGLNGDIDIKQIMQDFSGPLSGMAIGFGASLFGVVSAVILGINGYILFRSQDTLISGVEDWLKDRIIDIAPEVLGQTKAGVANTTNLPEQRKSFMDLFLEQMTNFTGEISKLTKSNENFHAMSTTLSSMKTIMEEQHHALQTLTDQQRGYSAQFAHFTAHVTQRDSAIALQHDEEKNTQALRHNQHTDLLRNHEASLQTLHQMLSEANQHQNTQHETAQTLVKLNEQLLHVNEQGHEKSWIAATQIQETVAKESEKILHALAQNDQTMQRTLEQIVGANHHLSEIFAEVNASAQMLTGIASAQTNHFDASIQAYAQMQNQMVTLETALHEEMQFLERFMHQTRENTDRIVSHQENAYTLFEVIQTSLVQTKQTLERVVELEEILQHEASMASSDTRKAIAEVEQAIVGNKHSLEALLSAHEDFYVQYAKAQNENHTVLDAISQTMVHENETSQALLQTTHDMHASHQSSSTQVREFFETVSANLVALDQTAQRSLEQNKAFEEAYFTQSVQSEKTMIQQLGQKIESTQQHVVMMEQSLKTIEEIIARLDKQHTLHGPSVADEIKGFFGSFFTKNQ